MKVIIGINLEKLEIHYMNYCSSITTSSLLIFLKHYRKTLNDPSLIVDQKQKMYIEQIIMNI